MTEETARDIRERQEIQEALFREVEEILERGDECVRGWTVLPVRHVRFSSEGMEKHAGRRAGRCALCLP